MVRSFLFIYYQAYKRVFNIELRSRSRWCTCTVGTRKPFPKGQEIIYSENVNAWKDEMKYLSFEIDSGALPQRKL